MKQNNIFTLFLFNPNNFNDTLFLIGIPTNLNYRFYNQTQDNKICIDGGITEIENTLRHNELCLFGPSVVINNMSFSFAPKECKYSYVYCEKNLQYYEISNIKAKKLYIKSNYCLSGIGIPIILGRFKYILYIKLNTEFFSSFLGVKSQMDRCFEPKLELVIDIKCINRLSKNFYSINERYFLVCFSKQKKYISIGFEAVNISKDLNSFFSVIKKQIKL